MKNSFSNIIKGRDDFYFGWMLWEDDGFGLMFGCIRKNNFSSLNKNILDIKRKAFVTFVQLILQYY